MTDLEKRLKLLEDAIKEVVSQRADKVCWMDTYVMLGNFVGIEVTPESLALLPTEIFLGNCQHFDSSLKTGCPYNKDYATPYIEKLEARVKELEKEILLLRQYILLN